MNLSIVKPRQRIRKLKDYSGLKFGRLTVLELVARDWGVACNHIWRMRCDCGAVVDKNIRMVRQGHTSSCGCVKREETTARNTTHGLSRAHPKTYRSWKDMRARCRNPNDSDYSDYGGRGITICAAWEDFATFLNDVGPRPEGMSLDRINVNGDYEPGNVRWASDETQANNKRNNVTIEYLGERKTVSQWCRQFGIDRSKVQYRLKQGMSVEQAFSKEDLRRHG